MIGKVLQYFREIFIAAPGGKWKLLIFTSGLLIIILFGLAVRLEAEFPGDFCLSCHEMQPEYYTWKASAHSRMACTRCHAGATWKSRLEYKVKTFKQLYAYLTKSYYLPINMQEDLDNEVCLSCHTVNRVVTASGDITLPHERHITKVEVACTECHMGIAHGNIAMRQLTLDGSFTAWTAAAGQAQMVRKNIVPQMSTCMDCHKSKEISLECEACHTRIGNPESHQVPDWTSKHGKLAKENLDNCINCHSYASSDLNLEDPTGGTVNKAAEYSRRNPFCADCHDMLPPSHQGGDWMSDHGKAAKPNSEPCLVCHSVGKPASAIGAPAQTYCNKCHTGIHKRGNWRRQHPKNVRVEGGVSEECFTCHSERQCARCHMQGT
ncbi:MAG: NapC/NirT family cytochrome c [Thermoanaerobacteraceae bacterium]|nr:NapC/NirT family cytochrome c [Thermoanaerobacteraceae bacterium]